MQHRVRTPQADGLIGKVLDTIHRFGMFTPGDKVLVGVSGGPDSVALLHLLLDLAPSLKIGLGAGYLNHGLRPEAARRESLFVMHLADTLGVAGHTGQVSLDNGAGSVEERAREARYRFYSETARTHGYTKIALGHHADDNAELVLMRLLRGSGARGLAGIPPVREGGIVRPLIAVRKGQLVDYLRQRAITYMSDASNSDPRYVRNRIRHQLLPLLEKEYNPNIAVMLNRMAVQFRDEEAWLQELIAPLVRRLIVRMDGERMDLNRRLLAARPIAVQRRVLRAILQAWRGTLWGMGADHVEALIDLTADTPNHLKANLPMGIRAEQVGAVLRFTTGTALRAKPRPGSLLSYSYTVDHPDCQPVVIWVAQAGCRLTFTIVVSQPLALNAVSDDRAVLFDAEQLVFPLLIRNFSPGDRLHPQGMRGSQKLQDLFVNRKIPACQRAQLPLLLSHGEIIWVVGVRRGSQALVTPDARYLLRVEVAWEQSEIKIIGQRPLTSPMA